MRKTFLGSALLGPALLGIAISGGVITATLAPHALYAQADLGTVTGVVTDASGATISKATVTVTNAATGAVRKTVTNSGGEYSITELVAGKYTVSVTAPNFGTTEEVITLSVGATDTFNAKLEVAGGKTEVVVSADDTTSVHLANSQISTVINPEQISNLPLPDRDPYALVGLSGNLSSQITGGDRGVGFEMGGARSASVDILLDGAENTDLYAVGVGQSVPLDATSEFSVVIAN